MTDIIYPSNSIYVAQSPISGLGVFARADIKQGEVIEQCPVIVIPEEEFSDLVKTKLLEYYFLWGQDYKSAAIVLGFGSLYNHSYEPNAKYIKEVAESRVTFVSIKDIKRDEEIIVNYNGHPEDRTKLWFEERGKHN